MGAVPAYTNPCVVADLCTPMSVFVMGVSDTTPGRLEIYRVSLADLRMPKATLLSQHTDTKLWDARAEKFCDAFDSDDYVDFRKRPSVFLQQFGGEDPASSLRLSSTALVLPNGTVAASWTNDLPKVSARLFSPTGAMAGHKWYTCTAPTRDPSTQSVWRSEHRTNDLTTNGRIESLLSTYPVDDALLSVGTFNTAFATPALGHLIVFDRSGAVGHVYTTSSTPSLGTNVSMQTLLNPLPVDMRGAALTQDAYPITMGDTGYIMDKTPSNTTILYSIRPSSGSYTLDRVKVKGDVPPFLPGRVATTRGTQIILFGGLLNGHMPVANFAIYDTITDAWSGLDLVKPPPPPTGTSPVGNHLGPTSKDGNAGGEHLNLSAIAGGVAGGVVVVSVVIGFLLYRRHTQKRRRDTNESDASYRQVHPAVAVMPEATERSNADYPPSRPELYDMTPFSVNVQPHPASQQLLQQQEHQHQQQQHMDTVQPPPQSRVFEAEMLQAHPYTPNDDDSMTDYELLISSPVVRPHSPTALMPDSIRAPGAPLF
ncbi:hypothetical protein BGZ73_002303 [Actinomortierella ambigua]|nr:hypothetical protein BGZ73_002303 [Actinomortierella ambigua]